MGTMRKLARTVAANQSYKKSGTTDMFGYYFKKIWREKAGGNKTRIRIRGGGCCSGILV